MSCDERTALLAAQTQRGHQHIGQQQQQQRQHIIVVPLGKDPKDPRDYEPVFTTAEHSYGLTLEELLPFVLDPWWQKLRRFCLGCLWLTFLLTLLASLTMAYYHDDAALVCPTNRVISSSPIALASNGTSVLSS